jgi:hypothetical protein
MLQDLRVQAQGANAADTARRWMSLSWLAVLVGSVYILSAKLSLSLLTPDGVAVFLPAAGVAAGALIAFGPCAHGPSSSGRWRRRSWLISSAIETCGVPWSSPCVTRDLIGSGRW